MAEVFTQAGEPVPESGDYACTLCGHREHFTAGESMPADHHPGHPWTLMVREST
jgi:hypothetical protein